MTNVTIMRNVFDPSTAERFEGVDSVRQTIVDQMQHWPPNARIYDGAVAQELDVTPRCPEDVEALENLPSGEALVVVYPADPITIIVGIIAVAAIAATLLLIPTIPKLENRQVGSANNQLSNRQNRSRPLGRIPDIYGTVRSIPDLIASPYTVFASNQETEVSLMCIGRGEFEITDVRDDTTLLSTVDGASAEFFAPGSDLNADAPFLTIGSAIGRDVLTSKRVTSVNGQVLEGASGTAGAWVGPFEISLRKMNRVSVNVVAVQGMFKDDGTQISATVAVELQVQALDDGGQPVGPPVTSTGSVVGSATDRDLKAVTITATLPAATRRATVRMRRTTALDEVFDGSVVDEVKWRDLYGMAPVTSADFGDVTTVMTETLGTAGALSLKNRKFNCLVTRKLPERFGDYGFTGLLATRSAAAALCHMALDNRIGRLTGGPPASEGGSGQVDVPQIYDTIAEVAAYFGIDEAGEFNFTFDREDLTFEEMAQIVATTAFCEAFRRGSLLRLFFERPQENSTLLFTHANKLPESETRTYSFGSLDSHDGVALSYVDPVDDALVTLYVPQGDDTAVNPMKVEGLGARGFEHAYLHAWRRWNRILYRRVDEKFTALQEADLLVRRERFLSVDTTRSTALDGQVMAQVGLTLTLSQIAVLDPLKTYTCFLQLAAGVTEAIACTQGAAENEVVLAEAPASALAVGDDLAYRTTYLITEDGGAAITATPMLLTNKDPGEGFEIAVEGINYDARYYLNDQDFVAADDENDVPPDDPVVVGGTPDPLVGVSISPASTSTAGSAPSVQRAFLAIATGGPAPSGYTWGVHSGPGSVVSASGDAANLLCYAEAGDTATAQFFCDMVIGGVTYRAFCTMTHTYSGTVFYPPPYEGTPLPP